jgi:hypothetical protein
MDEVTPNDPQPEQLDYPPGAMISDRHSVNGFQMQVQIDGLWLRFDAGRVDRDEMTMVQAYRAERHPGEKRRVLRFESITRVYVDEIEGDGDGETSKAELLARNEAATKKRLEQEQKRQQ